MQLHPTLENDCHRMGASAHGLVLLHRNASLPWFILVPDTSCLALYQLPVAQRTAVLEEWNTLAAWMHERFACARVNMAAIGNMVPQLHLHAVGRHEGDPLWPGVVWGRPLPEASWASDTIDQLRTELGAHLAISS